MTLAEKIATALAAYEADEPHTGEWGDQTEPYFPEYTWEQIKQWSETKHNGDCVNLPAPCLRCWADAIIHKARYIAEQIE